MPFVLQVLDHFAPLNFLRKYWKEYLKNSAAVFSFCCRPDGKKKAYVRLARDYDALDVANKIGII